MDFYHIGAMKVFSQLGQLIEADEVKLSDLPIDIMQKIGSYLLQDPNKTVHKTFKNRPDDDLQILLFGEVKDLTYINIHDCHNEIDYEMNDKIKNYVNFILKAKGIKNTCQTMRVKFYLEPTHIGYNNRDTRIIKIKFYDEKGDEIAEISLNHSILVEYRLKCFYNHDTDKWISQSASQTIQKKDITDEYESIKEEIINKHF